MQAIEECALLEAGDYVALLDAGAYGYSMAGNYNSRPLIAQIMVDKDKNYIIRKEQSFEDMIKRRVIIKFKSKLIFCK